MMIRIVGAIILTLLLSSYAYAQTPIEPGNRKYATKEQIIGYMNMRIKMLEGWKKTRKDINATRLNQIITDAKSERDDFIADR